MAGRILLDTNIVIAALASDSDVLAQIADTDEFFVSTTVLGELMYGAQSSSRLKDNRDRLDAFVSRGKFLECDKRTATHYGTIKTRLRRKGRPIPDNDIWIAASAMQHSLLLATRDVHFDEVDGIAIAKW